MDLGLVIICLFIYLSATFGGKKRNKKLNRENENLGTSVLYDSSEPQKVKFLSLVLRKKWYKEQTKKGSKNFKSYKDM